MATVADVFGAVRAGIASRSLVVDLTDVTFIDSLGVAALLELSREIAVRLVAPTGQVPRRVLELTQLPTVIPTYDTVETAVEDD